MSILSSPRRSRIAHFKAPFIISVASSTVLGFGCGGKTDTDTTGQEQTGTSLAQADADDVLPPRLPTTALACDGEPPGGGADNTTPCGGTAWRCIDGEWKSAAFSCNPPPAPSEVCPTSAPEVGAFCGDYRGGLSCDYAYCYDATAPMRRCSESTRLWEEIPVPSCNPPPPDAFPCEATLPVPGSDCSVADWTCSYPGSCESPSTAVCRSGQWLVTYSSGPACNPPAVVPVCPARLLVSGEGCAYEAQACSNEACESGAEAHDGHVCTFGQWQDAIVACPPGDSARDAGAADGGASD